MGGLERESNGSMRKKQDKQDKHNLTVRHTANGKKYGSKQYWKQS
jgi:hypothetical protein